MHVYELTMKNVRQFDSRTMAFAPGFNLIVGENGAGKTTVLRAIEATLARRPHTRWRLEDDDIRLGSTDLEIEADVAATTGEHVATRRYARQLNAHARRTGPSNTPRVLAYLSNEATCGSLIGRRARRTKGADIQASRTGEEWLFEQQTVPPEGGPATTRFGRSEDIREFLRTILVEFSPKFRDFVWTFEPFNCEVLIDKDRFEKDEDSKKLRRQLESAVLRYLRVVKHPLALEDSPWLIIRSDGLLRGTGKRKRITPPFGDLLAREGGGIEEPGLLDNWSVKVLLTPRVRIRYQSGETFLLSQQSDGEQRLFSLFVDIARQLSLDATVNQRIAEIPAIILIDEIDVHLHPKWQRMIVPMLERLFPACQFIATTHSPFVVQAVDERKVQHLDGKFMGTFKDRGIEEIAVKVMGIEHPEVGKRYLEMLDTAREYFRVLEQAKEANPRRRTELKNRLNELSRRYADNPAYQAYLELHGQLALGPDELR